jgi:hypothetical protein
MIQKQIEKELSDKVVTASNVIINPLSSEQLSIKNSLMDIRIKDILAILNRHIFDKEGYKIIPITKKQTNDKRTNIKKDL